MKLRFFVVVAICACAVLVFMSTTQTLAQTQKAVKPPAEYRGRIKVLDKDAKTISIQVKTATIQVKYNDQTKFTYRNKPGSIDDLKQNSEIIVLVDPQKKDMVAVRIDLRSK